MSPKAKKQRLKAGRWSGRKLEATKNKSAVLFFSGCGQSAAGDHEIFVFCCWDSWAGGDVSSQDDAVAVYLYGAIDFRTVVFLILSNLECCLGNHCVLRISCSSCAPCLFNIVRFFAPSITSIHVFRQLLNRQ